MILNAADILILAVLGLSTLFGLLRGFVREVLSVVCWVAAFWAAWMFGTQVATVYAGWLQQPAARLVAGYVTCFLGVLVVGALLGWLLHKTLDQGGLRGGDRFLGLLFGLGRGLVLVTFAVLVLGFTTLPREAAWWRQSLLLPEFGKAAAWVAPVLPTDVIRPLGDGAGALPAVVQDPISKLRDAATGPVGRAADARAASRAPGHGHARDDVGQ